MYSHQPSYRPSEQHNLHFHQHQDNYQQQYQDLTNYEPELSFHDTKWSYYCPQYQPTISTSNTDFVPPLKEEFFYGLPNHDHLHHQFQQTIPQFSAVATSVIVKREDTRDETTTESNSTSSPTGEATHLNVMNPHPNQSQTSYYSSKFTLSNVSKNKCHPSITNIDEESRRKRRRERNKVAATKCRIKKKEHVLNLNILNHRLEANNATLRTTLSELKSEESRLLEMMSSHQSFCMFKTADLNNNNHHEIPQHEPNNHHDDNQENNSNYRSGEQQPNHHINHNNNHHQYYESWRGSRPHS